MIETFIRRPVLSLVISLIPTLLGILALSSLPITQFPDIVPPSVVVTAKYTGANAEVCAKAVATPIERAINGVPGMTSISSVSTNNGITLIQVFFEVGTDPDLAAVNVQNRVTTVLDELPEEVIKAGVTTEKEVNSMLLYLNITSENDFADEAFIYNFADIFLLQELKRINGVGFAEIMGAKEYAMRIWLDPDKLLAYKISADEVIDALRKQNLEAAPGKLGESSGRSSNAIQYVLRYKGKFYTEDEYRTLVVHSDDDGSLIRLADVAEIEFGALNYSMTSKTDGRPSASIMLKQRPGSNAREVISEVKKRMAEMKETSFPQGMTYSFAYDVSRFLDASIKEVLITLLEAFLLVFLVVFIFLQDWRSTLIPALAVPVALISTLAFMSVMGFSINLLTLFALVLAIGIVVDNAIVVVEAVHVNIHQKHMEPMPATILAMKEIGGAIVAITLVMSAVFVPVAFLSGPVGVFYRQFSLTLAISIVISGVNALTLTPALCALILKSGHQDVPKPLLKFFNVFNQNYNRLEMGYLSRIKRMAPRRLLTWGLLGFFLLLTFGASSILPGGFIPTEDQGMIYVNVTTPPGATLERTENILDEIQGISARIPEVENVSTLAGYSILTETAGASYGMGMIGLKSWDDRDRSVEDIINQLRNESEHLKDASIEYFPPPTVPGFGNASGFEFRLLDRSGKGDLNKLNEVTQNLVKELNNSPVIGAAFTNFDPSFPQYMLHINQDLAAAKGVNIENAMNNLQTLIGSYYATNFIRFGQMYKVMVQAKPEYRQNPDDVLKLYTKNDQGEMVSYATFMSMERVFGPEQLTRYNMYNSALMTGDAAPGYKSGEAIKEIQKIAGNTLPSGYSFEWSGMTREQVLAGNGALWIFLLCVVFVYLLLSAQYESFLLPLAVLLSLIPGIFGAFIFLYVFGLENNIYAQVALVMLIGLLGKNAILVIEIALQNRKKGQSETRAAIQGALSRMRPIIMTSFAFIAGLLPLCLADGAGAMGNKSIGIAAAGGMFVGTLLGLMIIPGLFVVFTSFGRRKRYRELILERNNNV